MADSHISVIRCEKHGTCNSCCRPNFQSKAYQGIQNRLPAADVLFDVVISDMVIRLCPDCLKKLSRQVDGAMEKYYQNNF